MSARLCHPAEISRRVAVRKNTVHSLTRRNGLVCVRSSTTGQAPETPPTPLPRNPEQQVSQAAAAVNAAFQDGITQQRLELSLPLIGATDLDDWPGGIRQQFQAAQPMVEELLRGLKSTHNFRQPLNPEVWDSGDAVVAWVGEALAAVVFPTASTLAKVQALMSEGPPRLLLLVNPQWELKGNLMNDFGFGAKREAAEKCIDGFTVTYSLRSLKIYGDDIRLLRAYPRPWCVYGVLADNKTEIMATFDREPTYAEVEAVVKARPSSSINRSWIERLQQEWRFNQDSLKQ